jgi:hypothetical protein
MTKGKNVVTELLALEPYLDARVAVETNARINAALLNALGAISHLKSSLHTEENLADVGIKGS